LPIPSDDIGAGDSLKEEAAAVEHGKLGAMEAVTFEPADQVLIAHAKKRE
jgi:hypothetical protein